MPDSTSFRRLDTGVFLALGALCLTLPFDLRGPVLGLTTLKCHLIVVVALTGLLVALRRDWAAVASTRGLVPSLALAAALLLSCVWAPAERGNALKYTLRWVIASGLVVAVSYLARTPRRRAVIAGCLAGGAVLAMLACLAEIFGDIALANLFFLFREEPHWIGTELGNFHRLQGTFSHPNVLADYFAVLAPIGIGWVIGLRSAGGESAPRAAAAGQPAGAWRRRTALAVAAGVLLAVMGGMQVMTMSRAALVAMVLGVVPFAFVGLVPSGRRAWSGWSLGLPAAALSGIAAGVATFWPFMTRLDLGPRQTHEPAIEAPEFLTADTRQSLDVPIRVRPALPRQGDVTAVVIETWRLIPSMRNSNYADPERTESITAALPARARRGPRLRRSETSVVAAVHPDGWLDVHVPAQAPKFPGQYEVHWAVAVRGRHWLEPWSVHTADSYAVVNGGVPPRINRHHTAVNRRSIFPNVAGPTERTVYWKAAWQLIRRHPWTGVGADNFRLFYGEFVGAGEWDPRARTHNLYLEMLVNLGPIGLAAFAFYSGALARAAWRAVRGAPGGPLRWMELGLAAGLAAFYLHGMLDYLLGMTNMMCLFFIVSGLVWCRFDSPARAPV